MVKEKLKLTPEEFVEEAMKISRAAQEYVMRQSEEERERGFRIPVYRGINPMYLAPGDPFDRIMDEYFAQEKQKRD